MESNETRFPVLYLLMRTDLESMNPGKGHAQSHHNGVVIGMKFALNNNMKVGATKDIDLIKLWQAQTPQGYGTVITLAVTGEELHKLTTKAYVLDVEAGVLHDPTYPVTDGDVTHLLPMDTCGWIFGEKEDWRIRFLVEHLELCP